VGRQPHRITGGLAQAGQWLARKFVQIWKSCARPNGSVSPACAKPLGRCKQWQTKISQSINYARQTIKIIIKKKKSKN